MRGRATWQGAAFVVGATSLGGWLIAPFGHSNLDEGYLPAVAARLLAGERLYGDAIYARPPLSPWIHAVEAACAPSGYGLLTSRILFFAAMAAIAWFTVLALTSGRPGSSPGASRVALAMAGLAWSLLNFPPMAWHTVDGLLLGALGLAAIGAGAGPLRVVGAGALLGAAALTKQSFFPLVPLVLLWLLARREPRRAAWVAVGAASVGVAAGALLAVQGVVAESVAQVLGAGSPGALFHAGVVLYLRPLLVWALPLGVAAWWARRIFGGGAALAVLMVPPCLVQLVADLGSERFVRPVANFPAGWWWIAVTLALAAWRGGDRGRLLPFLGLAWCASISWGYPTPALGSTAMIVAFWTATAGDERSPRSRRPPVLTAAAGLLVVAGGALHPYGERPRSEIVEPFGPLCAEGRGMFLSAERAEVWRELRDARARHPGPFVVLPGMPAAHLCLEERSPVGADWTRNAEVGPAWPRLDDRLARDVAVAFIESDKISRSPTHPVGSRAVESVLRDWIEVERGERLIVYRNPRSDRNDGRDGR